MRKLLPFLTLAFGLQQAGSVHAQIPLRYRDTTVALGSSVVLGLQAPPTPIALMDTYSPVINIGFPFTFFDSTYTKCVISGNNYISFDTSWARGYSHFIYDNPQYASNFTNTIMFPFHDVDPSHSGTITYTTTGIAPHRKFIVEFCKVALFACFSQPTVTDQLILNEGSNTIEMHITSKPGTCTVFNGTGIQGLRSGANQVFVPGRGTANVSWSATNEGTMFTPAGITNYTISPVTFQPWRALNATAQNQVTWYNENNVLMGTGPSVTVTPGQNTHYYTARYTGMTGCDSVTRTFVDTVHVQTTTPLPLHLTAFTGKAEGRTHLLNWRMNEEAPGTKYILQHSTDAAIYQDIYTTGVQSQLQGGYTYRNVNTAAGDNFYRLQVLGVGGKSTVSQVVRIGITDKGANDVKVYPNPAGDYVNVACDKEVKLRQILLVDVTGNVKYSKTTSGDATLYTIPLQEIPAGIYYLKAITDKGVVTKSVTVTRL